MRSDARADLVVGPRHQTVERARQRVTRARLAAPYRGDLPPLHGVERGVVGGVDLEDAPVDRRIGGRRLRREPPLLERGQVPQGAEARARIAQLLALPRQHARQRQPRLGAPGDPLETAQRRDVPGSEDEHLLEERARVRKLLPRLDLELRQLEGEARSFFPAALAAVVGASLGQRQATGHLGGALVADGALGRLA